MNHKCLLSGDITSSSLQTPPCQEKERTTEVAWWEQGLQKKNVLCALRISSSPAKEEVKGTMVMALNHAKLHGGMQSNWQQQKPTEQKKLALPLSCGVPLVHCPGFLKGVLAKGSLSPSHRIPATMLK